MYKACHMLEKKKNVCKSKTTHLTRRCNFIVVAIVVSTAVTVIEVLRTKILEIV